MGLFSSKSTTKNKPTVASWMKDDLKNYANKTQAFLNSDPTQYVAPASELQNKAFAGVDKLGNWQAGSQDALSLAKKAGSAGAISMNAAQVGPAAQAGAVNIAPVSTVNGVSMLDYDLARYMNPALDSYVDATLDNFDETAGRAKAAMSAAAARGGAFGGSRYGLAEGQFAADTVRGRALTEAEKRMEAYQHAMGLIGMDADRAQGASAFNAGAENTRGLTQGQFDLQRILSNMDAANQFRLTQAGFDQNANQFNASMREQAYQRALQAAGISGDIANSMGANQRADLATMASLGEVQRDIDQDQRNAVPLQLQMAGGMYGTIPGGAYIGSTSKTKSSPGIGNVVMNAASRAAQVYGGGGFG